MFFSVRKIPMFGKDMFPSIEDCVGRDEGKEGRRIL